MDRIQKASIIIITFNNQEYTRLCLESILEKTGYQDYEVIVVDNASQDGTPSYLRELQTAHPHFKLIFNQTNSGFARANNQGASEAAGDALVFLNNDTVVTRGWLEGLLKYLEDPRVGMVGPVTNASGNQSRIPVTYEGLDGMDEFAERHIMAHQGEFFEIPMLAFHCVAMRRAVYQEIGPLDERFGIGMFEDDDYALRVKEKGYRILCAEDVFIHHWGSASFARMGTLDYWRLFTQNLEKFEAKWSRKWQPHQVRGELLPTQVKGMMEGSIWLAKQLLAQEKYFQGELHEREQAIYWLDSQLKAIYASNGWAFLQSLLRIRRRLVPEGSRREQLLHSLIQFLRTRRTGHLKAFWRQLRTLTQERRSRRQVATARFRAQELLIPADEPWPPHLTPWPLVSVLLPVHNHADLLAEAAHSILHGTYPNLELILLDDGSTDAIDPVLVRLASHPRVRVYRQPNQRLPRALTHAHRFARGQFITWTSSDNLLAPEAIETLVKTLLDNPAAVMAYADVALIDDDGQPLDDRSYRPQNLDMARPDIARLYRSDLPLGFEQDNYINACFLYRREPALALEGHYAEDLNGLEDYDFWLRLQKCGPFQHVGNREPLYFYRVHQRTMSHELLTTELDPHLTRGRQLMAYEARRREYCLQPWTFQPEPILPPEESDELRQLLDGLPHRAQASSKGGPVRKLLRVTRESEQVPEPLYIRALPHHWELVWRSNWTGEQQSLRLWRGLAVSPLALKAREHQKNLWEFPQAGERPLVGCHMGLADLPVDLDATRAHMAQNTQAFFVFVDQPGREDVSLGKVLVQGLENAVYLAARPIGEPYALYACFDALWIPPLAGEVSEHDYRAALALAYTISRPLIVTRSFPTTAAPYQVIYRPGASMRFVQALDRAAMNTRVLDGYLEGWTPSAALDRVARYADAITQDIAVPRPDFGIQPQPATLPSKWTPPVIGREGPMKAAVMVNTLDRGGLEELVAQLVRRLPDHGVETFVLCARQGGMVAERLKAAGVRVHVAEGQPTLIRQILEKEQPDLVNSHWSDLEFLVVASELGLPLIENIHNTYVWLDREGWQRESLRSRHFTQAIAVSDLVKHYYTHWNTGFEPDWISVVPNGIDPQRLQEQSRASARQELGIPAGDILFVMLASYDGRKNQLATLTAFDAVARQHPRAHLLCAGGIGDSDYFLKVKTHRETLASRDRIELHEFRQDTGTLLSAADALVINSFFEGWSLAATEALMLGVPLIHSECGSARELIGPAGERGVLVPNPACHPLELTWEQVASMMDEPRQPNTSALVEAMSGLIAASEQWSARREVIRTHARDTFGIEKVLASYARVFSQALGDHFSN